jgi:hypothetical protein
MEIATANSIAVTGDYNVDLQAAYDIGLLIKKPGKMHPKVAVHAAIREYNDSLMPEPVAIVQPEESIVIWQAPKVLGIEETRSQLMAMDLSTPIAAEPTGLELALNALKDHPDIAAKLMADFDQQQALLDEKKQRTKKASGSKVDPAIKRIENLQKYSEIYRLVTELISIGKTRSLSETTVAVQYETSQGRIHHWCVGYHLYSHYPEIKAAVDNGSYKLSELILNGLNSDRSLLISEKLGIDITVDIKF